jgi:hypothetical protein
VCGVPLPLPVLCDVGEGERVRDGGGYDEIAEDDSRSGLPLISLYSIGGVTVMLPFIHLQVYALNNAF